MTVTNGHLKLTPLEPERGRRVAVDMFFRSLADTHGPHATAIVLSGADGDGANGIKRIKECGGLTVAQEPDEAEHDSMPRSAIATGMVDWVLRVADMPARIIQYRENALQLRLPTEDGPQPARAAPPSHDEDEQALRDVLVFLRSRTSHDFTYYKRATILRRISRRMQINAVTTLPDYLGFLRTHPGEAGGLLQDLLISVTNFFRDRGAFAAVEKEIPGLFEDKKPSDVLRVWTAACATGEETYFFAMMLVEHARTLDHPPTIQVFGCDLDTAAIQTARAGVYPPSIVADVSEERLERFFTKDVQGYRVRRELREMVLFAEHDLLKDAPFSRMDLISCRNLLIYFDRDAQERAMEIFHFALKPDGRLFLGASESVDESKGLFASVDKKHRLYIRQTVPRIGLPVPTGTGTLLRALRTQSKEAPVVASAGFARGVAVPLGLPAPLTGADERAALTDLHFRLLERLAPPSAIINEQQDIVHLSENVGRFLQVVGGAPTMNLLRMVHPALRADLRAAVFRATDTKESVDVPGVVVPLEGSSKVVDLRVIPAPELAPGHLVVTFEARAAGTVEAADAPARLETESVVRHLEREVESLRVQLRDTIERYETSTEEYRASNEELQAMNEELRSASEELETSREELQSINEELGTVNLELKGRIEEIGQVNGDLQNFMAATDIATVFLDRDLRVMRYTPASVRFFNLIPGDTGRPLIDLKFQVEYPELIADARAVLRNLIPVEREVGKADGGGWYLARLLPYRTADDRIGGVVLTFVDITARKRAKEVAAAALQVAEQARGDAEAADQAKDKFLAVLSHELRTPLTPVVMAVGMLTARPELPPLVRTALEMIERNVRLEIRFIDDLLDMTRISRGKMEIVYREANLHEAIAHAVEVSTPDLTAKTQTLAVLFDATQYRLSGDFARLQQVFWNLLKNASKFTPERGEIVLRSRNEPGRIVVDVTDTGIGLEPEAIERVFQAFEQADASIAGEFGGLGLGLAIAKATVEAHGGELNASSPGLRQGATFTVSLPLNVAKRS